MKRWGLFLGLLSGVAVARADSKPVLYFGIDVFGVGGANTAFENDARDLVNGLQSLGISASGSTKTNGNGGIRGGLLFPLDNNFEIGASLGLLGGPHVDQNFHNGPFSVNGVPYNSDGETNIKTRTHFIRLLVEGAKKLPTSGKRYFRLSAGVGGAKGQADQIIETSGSAGTLVSALGFETRVTKYWSGFTWEIAPSFVFPFGNSLAEIGLRYAQFPTKKESDQMSKIEWTPLGAFLNVRFG